MNIIRPHVKELAKLLEDDSYWVYDELGETLIYNGKIRIQYVNTILLLTATIYLKGLENTQIYFSFIEKIYIFLKLRKFFRSNKSNVLKKVEDALDAVLDFDRTP